WTPGLRLHTTSRRDEWVAGKTETNRQTTRDFLRQSRAGGIPTVLAINADAFSPWPAPYDQPTPTDLAGLAVATGTVVSQGSGSPSLIQRKTGSLKIEATGPDTDTSDMELAVSGFALCLDNGQPISSGDDLHPRTGLGLSQDGRYLVAVAIDGRQPESLGATTQELGRWLRHFGAHRGINMDGGGSTTLAWWDPSSEDADKCRLLNRPVGNGVRAERLPAVLFVPTERANGNNLGVAIHSQQTTHDVNPLHNEPFVMGDEMLVYFNAFSRQQPHPCPFGTRSIGVARLRRDGFAGLQAAADAVEGRLITKPLQIAGDRLLLNVEQRGGEGSVNVALLDEQGNELPGHGFAESLPITTDAVRAPLRWKTHSDVASVRGRTARVALCLRGHTIVYALAFAD
ncbi:MAG: phosphodiester glycosidase family protein, partial [Planctomycetes bacterium]|nr:phosphodiester glycosidase family protein [Planctomycetota bacterium]